MAEAGTEARPTEVLLVPKLLLGNLIGCKALLCLTAGNPDGNVPFAKQELGGQVRPQAGAWEREESPSLHLTLTTDHWQLITL